MKISDVVPVHDVPRVVPSKVPVTIRLGDEEIIVYHLFGRVSCRNKQFHLCYIVDLIN